MIPFKRVNERLDKLLKDGIIEESHDERIFKFTPSFERLLAETTKECIAAQPKYDEIDRKQGKPFGFTDAPGMAVAMAYMKRYKTGKVKDGIDDTDILLAIRRDYTIRPHSRFPDGPPRRRIEEFK